MSFRESSSGHNAHKNGPEFETLIALEAAIERSQSYLLSQQKPEGYWVGELMVDATLVADMIAYHHWNGKVDTRWQRKAVNHILSMQLPDGGWNTYHGGPAEVNATIKAYLALKLAGVSVTDRRMLRAREMALNLGGVPRMNTFSKLYLALLGLFPWEYVPTIPCEVILIGKWFHVNFYEMSSWSRSMLVPWRSSTITSRPGKQRRSPCTSSFRKATTSAIWPCPMTGSGAPGATCSFGWTGFTNSPSDLRGITFIRSGNGRSERRSAGCCSAWRERTVWRPYSRLSSIH